MKKKEQDTINGVYIPKDMDDCMIQLDKILNDEDKQIIKGFKDKDSARVNLHFSLGLWIRNNWGLWQESRLWDYFINKGEWPQPDDMSGEIIEAYYDWLNKK